MVQTAKAALLVAPKNERSPAVGTQLIKRADATFSVTEHNNVLAQQANAQWRAIGFGHFLDHAGRHPVLPHQLPHRGFTFHTTKQIILPRSH